MPHVSVLILYTHPLLGLGLARLLQGETAVEVRTIEAGDLAGVDAAIDAHPEIVVVEPTPTLGGSEIRAALPDATVFDVSVDMGRDYAGGHADFGARCDAIVAAIRAHAGADTRPGMDA